MSTPNSTEIKQYQFGKLSSYLDAEMFAPIGSGQLVLQSDTSTDEKNLKLILPLYKDKIKSIVITRAPDATYQSGERLHGTYLMDIHNRVLIEIPNGIIGYDGSGPMLTKAILQLFGYDDTVFNQLNDEARTQNMDYFAVFQPLP